VTMAGPPTDHYVVDGVEEAVDIAGRHGEVLVVDLENTLVDYGSTPEQRDAAMAGVLALAAAAGGLRRVAFVSNARFDLATPHHEVLAVHALTKARKPYVRLPPLRHLRAELAGAAVYGDQPLTDGRLARNLGGIWLQPRHAHEPDPGEPWWPRVMRRRGERVLRRDFRPAGPAGPARPTGPARGAAPTA
jgi:predicted HAD superfamily phosphohydrolase YqeG